MKVIDSITVESEISRILDDARNGEEFTITDHGEPFVRMIPVYQPKTCRRSVSEIFSRIAQAREKATLGDDLTVRDLVTAGRR